MNKYCFQWLIGVNGLFQPHCTGKKCVWNQRCHSITMELELPDEDIKDLEKRAKDGIQFKNT